jgi:hypothetical protein
MCGLRNDPKREGERAEVEVGEGGDKSRAVGWGALFIVTGQTRAARIIKLCCLLLLPNRKMHCLGRPLTPSMHRRAAIGCCWTYAYLLIVI